MREFDLGEGCFSCDHRCLRIGQKVKCSLDNQFYWMNLRCTEYKPTTDNRILSYCNRVLPKAVEVSKWLTQWLRKNGHVQSVDTMK